MDNSLPLTCGPGCPIYDIAKHQCRLTGKPKLSREKCEFDYSIDNAQNIAENKPYDQERPRLKRERD